MRNYGQQVEDFEKEESLGGSGDYERVPKFQQRDIPIYDKRQHSKKIRTFWFVPMAKEIRGKKDDEPTYDWDNAVTPVWRYFQHYVPYPPGGDKKGFFTNCSGNHDLLLDGQPDPDACEVCRYAVKEPIAKAKRQYAMVGFNYSVRPVEIEEWIEQGRSEGERRKPDQFPAKLWVFQMGVALYKEIMGLRKQNKDLDNCLHLYKVELKKIFDGPADINVHYEVEFNADDLENPPEFSPMEMQAIKAFSEGEINEKGERVYKPDISFIVEPTPLDRQLKKLSELARFGRTSEEYANNRFGEDREVKKREPAKAASGSGRFSKKFGGDEEDDEVDP